jgi:hypothetical protein
MVDQPVDYGGGDPNAAPLRQHGNSARLEYVHSASSLRPRHLRPGARRRLLTDERTSPHPLNPPNPAAARAARCHVAATSLAEGQ